MLGAAKLMKISIILDFQPRYVNGGESQSVMCGRADAWSSVATCYRRVANGSMHRLSRGGHPGASAMTINGPHTGTSRQDRPPGNCESAVS